MEPSFDVGTLFLQCEKTKMKETLVLASPGPHKKKSSFNLNIFEGQKSALKIWWQTLEPTFLGCPTAPKMLQGFTTSHNHIYISLVA
jgi:hypothetical protein